MKRVAALLFCIIGAIHGNADCSFHNKEVCPKLAHAPVSKLRPGVPPFIYSAYGKFYVEMRDGKVGSDCDGETDFRGKGQLGVVILSDSLSDWGLRETLHHEVSHIAAMSRDDGRCSFKDEDQAVEHFSPGWVDILRDQRNRQLVEFLTK